MPSNKRYPLIKYTARDFNSIRQELIEYAKKYYPDTFQDFSEAGFGSLMIDSTAYIGDVLSFYLDYSVNELFLDTALEFNDVLKIGKQMGYRFQGSPASFGSVDLYILVPSLTSAVGVDPDYLPILKKGSTFSSLNGINFTLTENVNFSSANTETAIGAVDPDTGAILSYALRTSGRVVSGVIESQQITIGDFSKFLKVSLKSNNVTEILSVIDSEGHNYYEVDYLAQDTVYLATTNQGADSSVTQASMTPFSVPRRFVVDRHRNKTFLQFGHGQIITEATIDPLIDPSKIVIESHGRDYYVDSVFDPTNLIKTDKLGVAPANTILTVVYRTNDVNSSNSAANSITTVASPFFEFGDESLLNSTSVDDVVTSLEVNNAEPIIGDVTTPTTEELKIRISNVFSSQSRAVTEQDYKALCYSMPAQFGSIKRVNIKRDPGSLKRNLNLYILAENDQGNFIKPNSTIKTNLKTWLNSSRMINDTIDVIDAKIVNLGIEYIAIASLDINKYDALEAANTALRNFYLKNFEIGEAFNVGDIFNTVNKVEGIIDVTRVKIVHQTGINYSPQAFNVEKSYSDDGRFILAPDNVAFEIKFPNVDIRGTIK